METEDQTNYGHLIHISETCRRLKVFIKIGKDHPPVAITKKNFPTIANKLDGIKMPHYKGSAVLDGETCDICAKVSKNSNIKVWRADEDTYLCKRYFGGGEEEVNKLLLCELWPVSERRRITVYHKRKPYEPHYDGFARIKDKKLRVIARMDENTNLCLTFLSIEEYLAITDGSTRKDLSDDPEHGRMFRKKGGAIA